MPLPLSISYFWNLGSMLGLLMGAQILSGLMLSMHYVSHINYSFTMVIGIVMDLDSGLLLRFMHCNGSSLLFMMMYLHMFKGMYYCSNSSNTMTWLLGSMVYVLMMLIAFLGYVLPWGQMSYWGATVISSLITTIPGLGKWLLIMIWGDYSVNNSTLNRFYTLHFILPFAVLLIIILHLILLHHKGSTTVVSSNKIMLPMSNYFMLKDLVGFIFLTILLLMNVTYFSNYFLDSENSVMASPLITPIHIVPEWYFLYAYCILKSFESKVIGVIMLLLSVAFFPLLAGAMKKKMSMSHKIVMLTWFVNFIILTKMGAVELNYPYSHISLVCTLVHFLPLGRV